MQTLRMCVACRQMKEKNELVRVVHSTNGYYLDEVGKMDGRGAYICKNKECIAKAVKNKSFHKSFKANIPLNIYEMLEEKFGK